MKALKCSLAAKTLAVLLLILLMLVCAAGTVAAVFMIELDFYNSPDEALYTLQKNCGKNDANWLVNELDLASANAGADSLSADLELRLAESPMRYAVSLDGQTLYDGLPGNVDELPESSRFDYSYARWDMGYGDDYREYTVLACLDPDAELTGSYRVVTQLFKTGYHLRYAVFIIILSALVASVAIFVFLMAAAGCRAGTDEIGGALCRFPFDVETAAVAAIVMMGIYIMLEFADAFNVDTLYVLICAATLSVLMTTAVLYFMSLAVRLKRRTLLRELLICVVVRWLWRGVCACGRAIGRGLLAIPLVWRTSLVAALLGAWLLILSMMGGFGVVLMFATVLLLAAAMIWCATQLRRMCDSTRRLADGSIDNTRPPVDTSGMVGELRELGDSINRVSDGMNAAVEARMRSERFKTELITNVSHDLKTPLTSIINYSDLIAREPTDNENIHRYAVELTHQSERLKGLIVDLVEASKAATGNIELDMQRCDMLVLLTQAVGEYQLRLEAGGLTLVSDLPTDIPHSLHIIADAPRLWRVLDNLMGNALKYSQPGTRVYLALWGEGERVLVSIKNTSREQLNIPADELMERFVRGDSSRHTDGSGLGLSISKSLTELMGGELRLTVDGDLFKVTLSFPRAGA